MKSVFSLILVFLLFFGFNASAQTGLDKIGQDFEWNQPYPDDLQDMVDILTSPFIVVESDGDLFGFTTYALASAYYTPSTDVILNYGEMVIDTGFVHYWAAGGSVVSATSGTDAAATDGDRYWVEVHVTNPTAITGLNVLIGSVGGTDSVIVELFDFAGTLVASNYTDIVSVIAGTAAQFQAIPFDAVYFAKQGIYYASVQFNGTTAKFRAYGVTGSKFVAGTASGTFGTAASITPGTTFTADKGAILHTY
ncbi:MAG: hypothetical protein ACW99A_13330 [Candidatus Kariarchaeaceae archaeon]|jgi:hypothetical protein